MKELLHPADPKMIEALWEKLSVQDHNFDDNSRGDIGLFLTNLFMPNIRHFIIGDLEGYIVVSNIQANVAANIHHAIFNDKYPIRQIMEAGKEVMGFMFKEGNLMRMGTAIPEFNKYGVRFATLMGFKYEGALRKAFLSKGKYHDVLLYGLLRDEFLKKEVIV